MTEKEYNESAGVRRSALWKIQDSPEKYKWFLDHPEPETAALTFGRAAHKLLLEPELFFNDFAVAPRADRRTKAGKELWDEFIAHTAEQTIITNDDYEVLTEMARKALTVPGVEKLLKGDHEVPITWIDADTDMLCKAKLDAIANVDGSWVITDYKTAANASTGVFNSKIFSLGYHLQAYMYTEGAMHALHLKERPDFVFIVQEKKAPYAVNLVRVTEDVINAGAECFAECMDTLKQCTDMDFWPGYNGFFNEMNETYLPGYLMIGKDEED